MSRTHNTNPLTVQGYRARGERCPSDWRERQRIENNPGRSDPIAWEAWMEEAHPYPPKGWVYMQRQGCKGDRQALWKRARARERQAINRGDYDADLRPESYKGWLWWRY